MKKPEVKKVNVKQLKTNKMKTKTTNENLVNNSNQTQTEINDTSTPVVESNNNQKREDLYRFSYIQENPLRVVDWDGIPLNLLIILLSEFESSENISKLSVKYLDEEELKSPIHKSHRYVHGVEYKTIGDYFYSDSYQHMVNSIIRSR